MDAGALIGGVQKRPVQQRKRLVMLFQLHQLTRQDQGDLPIVGAGGGGAAQFGERLLRLAVLFQRHGQLSAGGGIEFWIGGPDPRQGVAGGGFQTGAGEHLGQLIFRLVIVVQVLGEAQIDGGELIAALGRSLGGGGDQALGGAFAEVGQGGRAAAVLQPLQRAGHARIDGLHRHGGFIQGDGVVAATAPFQKLAIGAFEQGADAGDFGSGLQLDLSLGILAALLQQGGAIDAGESQGQGIAGGRDRLKRPGPVARRRRDPRRDQKTGAGVRGADGLTGQFGVRRPGVAAHEVLHQPHQPSALDKRRRRGRIGRGQGGRHVQIAGQQGGGEGLFANARLFRCQPFRLGQIVRAGRPLALHQGQLAGQIQTIGAAALGVRRDRRPDGRDRRRRGRVGNDDVRIGRGLGRRLTWCGLARRRLARLQDDGRRMGFRRRSGRGRFLSRGMAGKRHGEDGQRGGEQARTGGDHARTLHAFAAAGKGGTPPLPRSVTCSDSWGRRRPRAWSRRCSATDP